MSEPLTTKPWKTLLIVDDEEPIHKGLARTLRKEPYRLLHAYESAEALALLEQHPEVDAVLSDHYMPGVRGLEFLMEVRRRHPKLPTMLLTAQADLNLAMNSINKGHVSRFFTKPWDADRLRAELRALLGLAPDPVRESELADAGRRLRAEMAPPQDEHGAWILDPTV